MEKLKEYKICTMALMKEYEQYLYTAQKSQNKLGGFFNSWIR